MGRRAREYVRRQADQRSAARRAEWEAAVAELEKFDREYLPTERVATILAVAKVTLRRWRSTGAGPRWIKFGSAKQSRVRYPLADLRLYMADPAAYRPTVD